MFRPAERRSATTDTARFKHPLLDEVSAYEAMREDLEEEESHDGPGEFQ